MRDGVGTVVLDARRDGSDEVKGYTFPALVCTDKTIRERRQLAMAARQAVLEAQRVLKREPQRATEIGRKLFPPQEAELIAELIRRDAPFYDADITAPVVDSMNQFARSLGLLTRKVSHKDVVWNG